MDRRKVDRRNRRSRQPFHIAAHHILLKADGQAVGRFVNARTKVGFPILKLCDQRIGARGICGTRNRTSGHCGAPPKEGAAGGFEQITHGSNSPVYLYADNVDAVVF